MGLTSGHFSLVKAGKFENSSFLRDFCDNDFVYSCFCARGKLKSFGWKKYFLVEKEKSCVSFVYWKLKMKMKSVYLAVSCIEQSKMECAEGNLLGKVTLMREFWP